MSTIAMDDQLKQLLEYTRFHLGMYTTLATVIIAAYFHKNIPTDHAAMLPWLKASLVCFLVASSIPDYRSFRRFSRARLGPWHLKLIPARVCSHIEHTAFWLGCTIAVVGLFLLEL